MRIHKITIDMGKWNRLLLFCLSAAWSFQACIMDIDKELPDCAPVPAETIAVTATLYNNGQEKAWPDGSRIGVMMLQSGTGRFVSEPPVKPYSLGDASVNLFLPVPGCSPVSRPEEGTVCDATGVYPAGVAVSEGPEAALSVADQSDPQALDLITARRTAGITSKTDTIHLDFYRQMCRLLFNLSLTEIDASGNRTNADSRLAGAILEIDGMNVSGAFSWNDFALAVSNPGVFRALMAAGGKNGQAVVFPRAPGAGVTFRVTLPYYTDTVYTFTMDPALALSAGKSYTFDVDLEYRKKAPQPAYHQVTYEYDGNWAGTALSVEKKNGTAYDNWNPAETVTVNNGGDFTFRYTKQPGFAADVTVTLNGKVLGAAVPGGDVAFGPVTEDMHFVFYDRKHYAIALVINLAGMPTTEATNLVIENDRFEIPVPAGMNLIVKVNGVLHTPVGGKYVIEHVTEDTVITVTGDKGAEEPDLSLKADVHDWDELPVVDGGLVTPDNN